MGSSFYSGSGLTATEQDSIESAIAAAQAAQSGAETAKTASETAKTGAETAETNAEAAQAAAEAAKVSAEAARDTANSSSSSASTSAATATTQAQAASTSASSASTSATTATTQAATATTQAQAAAASASSASTSAATATTQANNSSTSAAAALASKNAAAASEAQVSTDASTATTQAGNSATSATASSNSAAAALVSQNAAAASASSASTDAATATTKAGESSTSAAAALASQNASASSASAASTSATSAASSLSSFQNQYLGASGSAPTQDPDGSALDLGDLYFDTTANVMKVYSASGWTNASSSVNGTSERQTYTATANQTTFSVTYDAGFVDVWLNGAKLLAGTDFTATSGTNIVLASGAAAGDIVDIIAFGTFVFTSNDHYTKSASDTRYVQVAGDTMTGDLTVNGNLNVAGTTVTIDSANAQTVDLGDNDKIRLGDGDDLQIYHDGSHSYVDDTGTGRLYLRGNDRVQIQKYTGDDMITAIADGAVKLYYDNSNKLETTSTGVDVTGNATFADNGKAIFGAGSDLSIYHSGSHSYITDSGTGSLLIQGSDLVLEDPDGNNYLHAADGGAVQLYNNGSSKLATTSSGITVTGNIANTSGDFTLDVAGDIILDADGGTLKFKDGGTHIANIGNSSSDLVIENKVQDKDIKFMGDDGGAGVTALTLDMSNAGAATFNSFIYLDYIRGKSDNNTGINIAGSDVLAFQTGGSESGRFNSSGELLIGKTTNSIATAGTAISDALGVRAAVDGNIAALFNRLSSNGNIVQFRYASNAIGNIAVNGDNNLQIFSDSSNHSGLEFATHLIAPLEAGAASDGTISIGASSARFDDIYATNGSIQTSDANEKQDIEALSDAEKRVATAAKGLIKKFRWKDKVTEKGDDARIHVGIVAQDLKAAFEAEGLDAGRYAMFISTTWWEANRVVPAVEANEEEGIEAVAEHTVTDTFNAKEEAPEGATERTRLGVRYSELLAFIIGAM